MEKSNAVGEFHLAPDQVDNVLAGLVEHTLLAMPAVWVQV